MIKQASYACLTDNEWDGKIAELDRIASRCELCPRRCGVDRLKNTRGFCGAPGGLVISSIFPHHGEEPPISGTGGSGTVFFTYCTLKCVFCQNFQLSHLAEGVPYTPSELAERMLALQAMGCHNINLVTPTHFLPWILKTLKEAARKGLTIPIVYNSGGYELASVMSLLAGIVDIYLPDMKYGNNAQAKRYSGAPDYGDSNRAAIREMFRQVGPLRMDGNGIAYRGLCIRHLVLPEGGAGTEDIYDFLTSTFDPHDLYLSLMAQYRPMYRAGEFPEINRTVTREEYEPLRRKFIEAGFGGFYQDLSRMNDNFIIDFKKRKSERLTGDK
jgi:putative pyruvate formate lyase activating enzyme